MRIYRYLSWVIAIHYFPVNFNGGRALIFRSNKLDENVHQFYEVRVHRKANLEKKKEEGGKRNTRASISWACPSVLHLVYMYTYRRMCPMASNGDG